MEHSAFTHSIFSLILSKIILILDNRVGIVKISSTANKI